MNELPFKVVLNEEEQYSVWPAQRANPAGWRDEGTRGTRDECLDHIESVWRDMRPRTVRLRATDGA
ncbi:MbtH family protein [Plantactinospora sp. WMMB334]|uniref:MbtH family protein n=1 Tax=Plantactinospora sp. WMMB334 TaxID=3404119 RepID=UPI003B92EB7A